MEVIFIILHHCICVQYCPEPPEKKDDITGKATESSLKMLSWATLTWKKAFHYLEEQS